MSVELSTPSAPARPAGPRRSALALVLLVVIAAIAAAAMAARGDDDAAAPAPAPVELRAVRAAPTAKWTAEIGGDQVDVAASGSFVFVSYRSNAEGRDRVHIEARRRDDGDVVWSEQLDEPEQFSGATVRDDYLFAFRHGRGATLLRLDGGSGEVIWRTEIENVHPKVTVMNEDLALLSEAGHQSDVTFVDVRDGSLDGTAPGWNGGIAGGRVAGVGDLEVAMFDLATKREIARVGVERPTGDDGEGTKGVAPLTAGIALTVDGRVVVVDASGREVAAIDLSAKDVSSLDSDGDRRVLARNADGAWLLELRDGELEPLWSHPGRVQLLRRGSAWLGVVPDGGHSIFVDLAATPPRELGTRRLSGSASMGTQSTMFLVDGAIYARDPDGVVTALDPSTFAELWSAEIGVGAIWPVDGGIVASVDSVVDGTTRTVSLYE
jgi:outer membrane protein assembly factor BamB